MYGGLPTQYNPHSTSQRRAALLQTLPSRLTELRDGGTFREAIWQSSFRTDGSDLWSYLNRYFPREGVS